jgi:hypothetical protein
MPFPLGGSLAELVSDYNMAKAIVWLQSRQPLRGRAASFDNQQSVIVNPHPSAFPVLLGSPQLVPIYLHEGDS